MQHQEMPADLPGDSACQHCAEWTRCRAHQDLQRLVLQLLLLLPAEMANEHIHVLQSVQAAVAEVKLRGLLLLLLLLAQALLMQLPSCVRHWHA